MFKLLNLNPKTKSNSSGFRSFGTRQLGSVVRNVSRRVGIDTSTDEPQQRAKYLPVVWKPTRSTVVKTGIVVIALTAAAIVISRLIKRFVSDLD